MAPKRSHGQMEETTSPGTPSVRSTKKARFSAADDIILVSVSNGSSSKTFRIFKSILIQHSDFCAAALSKDWKEAQEGAIDLPDVDIEAFEIFTNFVYTGKIHSTTEVDCPEEGVNLEWNRLGQCWVVGDRLLSQTFRDAVMDALTAKRLSGSYSYDLFEFVYRNTSRDNALRRFVVDLAVFAWNMSNFEREPRGGKYGEFFRDVAIRLRQLDDARKGTAAPWLDAGCTYHEHGDDKPCYTTMF